MKARLESKKHPLRALFKRPCKGTRRRPRSRCATAILRYRLTDGRRLTVETRSDGKTPTRWTVEGDPHIHRMITPDAYRRLQRILDTGRVVGIYRMPYRDKYADDPRFTPTHILDALEDFPEPEPYPDGE